MENFGLQNTMFDETDNWFDYNIPIWLHILSPLKETPLKYLEIGCYKGRSMCWMLLNILTHAKATAVAMDPFSGSIEHHIKNNGEKLKLLPVFKNNIAQTKADKKVRIMQNFSQEGLVKLLSKNEEETYDIIYVDGSHTAYDVMTDAVLAWRLLKPNGILIFDDYTWTFDGRPQNEPKIAVDAFLLAFKDLLAIVHIGRQVFVKKLKSSKL